MILFCLSKNFKKYNCNYRCITWLVWLSQQFSRVTKLWQLINDNDICCSCHCKCRSFRHGNDVTSCLYNDDNNNFFGHTEKLAWRMKFLLLLISCIVAKFATTVHCGHYECHYKMPPKWPFFSKTWHLQWQQRPNLVWRLNHSMSKALDWTALLEFRENNEFHIGWGVATSLTCKLALVSYTCECLRVCEICCNRLSVYTYSLFLSRKLKSTENCMKSTWLSWHQKKGQKLRKWTVGTNTRNLRKHHARQLKQTLQASPEVFPIISPAH